MNETKKNSWGDVPDDFITKKHLIINRTLWKCVKEFGWEEIIEGFSHGFFIEAADRLNRVLWNFLKEFLE